MNWRGLWFLGTRYLVRHKKRTILLVSAFTLVWLLPAAIAMIVNQVERELRSRAVDTPLLVGKSGSALELVFNGLYFTKPEIGTMPFGEIERLQNMDHGSVIPVYSRFSAGEHRIVGTSLDYFRFRNLEITEGRNLLRLGDCVIGSGVAEANEIKPGDSLISSPETLFDLGGVYPLKLNVVGILSPTGGPDDGAIFVDVKTCWIIEGLGHGHDDAESAGAEERIEEDEESGVVRLNASITEYNEITPENAGSFHFHGEISDYPVTAAIVIPFDARDQALFKGKLSSRDDLQVASPQDEMSELFDTVFSIQRLVTSLLFAVGLATLLIGSLVFLLSNRLRRDEFRQMRLLGADFRSLRGLLFFEGAFVLISSLLACGFLLAVLTMVLPAALRVVIG